jgi:hypothetical protein
MKMQKRVVSVMLAVVMVLSLVLMMPVGAEAKKAKSFVKKLTLSEASVTMDAGTSEAVTATVKVKKKASTEVTVKSNDESICTVDPADAGKGTTEITITGVKEGSTTVTVTTVGADKKGNSISKNIAVTVNAGQSDPGDDPGTGTGFNAATDMTVTNGQVNIYVEFTINKDHPLTPEEAAECGLTISEDGETASGNVPCNTATYTFKKLPGNLEELQTIPLDTMFGPMAAGIAAVASYQPGVYNMQTYDKCPQLAMFDYLNGPGFDIPNVQKQNMFITMRTTLEGYGGPAQGSPFMYFEGATPENGYTPNEPFSFMLVHGPYQVPATQSIGTGQMLPERQMILISFAGDDSQRYCDVYQSKVDNNWYIFDDSWQHLVAGAKPAQIIY